MNIDWVVVCHYVEVHDSLATIVGAGIDTYWMGEGPGPLQVVLAVRALATPDELEDGGQHTIRSTVRAPSGDLVGELVGELAIGGETHAREWLAGITVPMIVQFDALEEGTFTLEVSVDDASRALPIHVVHGLPPAV